MDQPTEGRLAYSSQNTIPFTSIGLDQTQEHQNRKIKDITLLKYCLAAPELAKISEEKDTMIGNTATSSKKASTVKYP
ncbi:hypothetical protein DPMN_040226 [Dreissena polymorpha]|uniref:Uncharacterized protein n=1 Tax=Dreissena polymorpha TaxID=45954 RepID=A0A9D4CXE3_DREPO|nr:hypothetical protein DPMN_040226 [Dreissena polymorpha]